MTRVLVCGGRDFADRRWLWRELNKLHKMVGISVIIQGGAKGADRLAAEWAANHEIATIWVFAEWDKHGKAEGAIRNKRMLTEFSPDIVIPFPGGKGTSNMVAQSQEMEVIIRWPTKAKSN